MKRSITLLSLLISVSILSCGGANKYPKNDTGAKQISTVTPTTSSESVAGGPHQQDQKFLDEKTLKKEKKLRHEMYVALKMTKNQVRRFEVESNNFLCEWEEQNPDQIISYEEHIKNRDHLMSKILSQNQMIEYLKWSQEHQPR